MFLLISPLIPQNTEGSLLKIHTIMLKYCHKEAITEFVIDLQQNKKKVLLFFSWAPHKKKKKDVLQL